MLSYLVRRLALTIPVLLGVATLVFSLIHFIPGDPAQAMLGEGAAPEDIAQLRQRLGLDRPLLADRFWRQSAERIGSKAVLGQSAVCALARYDWPGNVRELQNVLTALVVAVSARGVVGASELPAAIARAAQLSSHESLESARLKFEERFVRAALARAAGHRGQTAAALGLSRQGLAKLMQRLHLDA